MKPYFTTKKLCFVALFTAINVVLSSFGIPVPGGHLYFNDIIICFASLLFDPLSAFIVGGVGAFWGDFFFYPTPMFVSLAVHGLQAVLISIISHCNGSKVSKKWLSVIALVVGVIIMVGGYSLGRAYIYGTPEYAITKLPCQILQAVVGAVVGFVLYFKTPLNKYIVGIDKKDSEKENKNEEQVEQK